MRIPNRIATRDVFVPSIATPGRYIPPTGGDGTFPVDDPGTVGGGGGSGGSTITVPVVYFRDLTVGSTTWSWSFETTVGDVLGISAVQNPTFTFPGPGTYSVSLLTDVSVTPRVRSVVVV